MVRRLFLLIAFTVSSLGTSFCLHDLAHAQRAARSKGYSKSYSYKPTVQQQRAFLQLEALKRQLGRSPTYADIRRHFEYQYSPGRFEIEAQQTLKFQEIYEREMERPSSSVSPLLNRELTVSDVLSDLALVIGTSFSAPQADVAQVREKLEQRLLQFTYDAQTVSRNEFFLKNGRGMLSEGLGSEIKRKIIEDFLTSIEQSWKLDPKTAKDAIESFRELGFRITQEEKAAISKVESSIPGRIVELERIAEQEMSARISDLERASELNVYASLRDIFDVPSERRAELIETAKEQLAIQAQYVENPWRARATIRRYLGATKVAPEASKILNRRCVDRTLASVQKSLKSEAWNDAAAMVELRGQTLEAASSELRSLLVGVERLGQREALLKDLQEGLKSAKDGKTRAWEDRVLGMKSKVFSTELDQPLSQWQAVLRLRRALETKVGKSSRQPALEQTIVDLQLLHRTDRELAGVVSHRLASKSFLSGKPQDALELIKIRGPPADALAVLRDLQVKAAQATASAENSPTSGRGSEEGGPRTRAPPGLKLLVPEAPQVALTPPPKESLFDVMPPLEKTSLKVREEVSKAAVAEKPRIKAEGSRIIEELRQFFPQAATLGDDFESNDDLAAGFVAHIEAATGRPAYDDEKKILHRVITASRPQFGLTVEQNVSRFVMAHYDVEAVNVGLDGYAFDRKKALRDSADRGLTNLLTEFGLAIERDVFPALLSPASQQQLRAACLAALVNPFSYTYVDRRRPPPDYEEVLIDFMNFRLISQVSNDQWYEELEKVILAANRSRPIRAAN